jgi:cell division protein FtsW (lipid II flippase)
MDYSHIHLFTNHIPIWGGIIAFIIFVYSAARNKKDFLRFSLLIFIIIALAAIIIYLTGEPAGEPIKNLPGISEEIIDKHEEASLLPFILIEVLGAASIFGLIVLKKYDKQPGWFIYSFIIVSIVYIVSVAWAANLGGQIRHTEIRPGQMHIENNEKPEK